MIVPDRFGDNSLDVIPVRVWYAENGRMRWLYLVINIVITPLT